MDYEKIFKYRNMEMIGGIDDLPDSTTPHDSKTPFEILKTKMVDVTPEKNEGVLKRVLTPGFGLPIPLGSHVRSKFLNDIFRKVNKSILFKFIIMRILK